MEWLKAILEKAVVNDDGKLDVDGTLKCITVEFPKHAVSKADFNAKVEELKTASGTIETLKKDNKENEGLQTAITQHENTISELKKRNEDMGRNYRLKEALSASGCTDADYLIYKHGGLDKFSFDKEGNPVGVEEVLKGYKESNPILFPTGRKEQSYNPQGGIAGNSHANPFAKESFNLTEQGNLFKTNPIQAKELAAAVGITI